MNNFDDLSLTSPATSTFSEGSPPLSASSTLPNPPRLANPPSAAHSNANQRHKSTTKPLNPSGSHESYSPRIPPDEQYHTGEEGGDPKRRRIARACDMCRKKKIKCDGKTPKCTHCVNYKTDCVTTHVEKKRNPPKGAKYIEGLENRLSRMERLLRLSGLFTELNSSKTDLSKLEEQLLEKSRLAPTNDPHGQNRAALYEGADDDDSASEATLQHDSASRSDAENSDEKSYRPLDYRRSSSRTSASRDGSSESDTPNHKNNQSEMLGSLMTDTQNVTRYMGPSSVFSLFSPKGAQWVNERTGDTSFQDLMATAVDHSKCSWVRPEILEVATTRPVYQQLPPRAEALSLFRDYFDNFNFIVPLFHEPTFMHLVDRQYSNNPYQSNAWWACINVVLSIAHSLRAMSKIHPREEQNKAWLHFKNALGVFTELALLNTNLLTVQALLGMTIVMQCTQNPHPSFSLLSTALRAAHSVGLHRRGTAFNLNPIELEQRKRVFWIAYLLDKDMSIRSGRPSVQDDGDMNVDLPLEDPPDNVGNIPLPDGKGKANYLRIICRFGLIASKVYSRLYSTRAFQQTDGELLNVIGELDRELEEWKESIPLGIQPDSGINVTHQPLVLHIISMHFSYYNCLATIHRMSVHHGYFSSRLSNYAIQGLNSQPLNPRIFSSSSICVQAARSTIHLVKFIPRDESGSCTWAFLYYPIAALITLFAHVIQNPQDLRARSDVKLMSTVINFLSLLSFQEREEPEHGLRRALFTCCELERIANNVIDRVEKENLTRQNSKVKSDPQKHEGAMKQLGITGSSQATGLKRLASDDASMRHNPAALSLAGSKSSAHVVDANNIMNNPKPVNERNNHMPRSNFEQGQPTSAPAGMPSNILNTDDPMTGFNNASYGESCVQMPNVDATAANPMPFRLPMHNPDLPPEQNPQVPFGDTSAFPPFGPMDMPGQVPSDTLQFPMGLEWDWPDLGLSTGLGFGLSSFVGGAGAWGSMIEDPDNGGGDDATNMQGGGNGR